MAPWGAWLSSNWLPASGVGGNNSNQGDYGSKPLTVNNNDKNPFITNDSDDPIMRERLFRREFCNQPRAAVEDIDANWMEVDSDIDSPVDDNYDPRAYRPPVSKLEMASNMASNATTNLTATAGSLASAATSIVASAATSAVQTAIQTATNIATGHDSTYRGLSTRDSVRDPFDDLRFRIPGQRLRLWETEMPRQVAEVPEDMERSTLSGTGLRALSMDLSEIVRVEQKVRESKESVSTNSRRSRCEKKTRREGLKGAGSGLGNNSQVKKIESEPPRRVSAESERNDNEDGNERGEVSSSENSDDDSFDSVHEVLDNRGKYIVEKVQRRFQRRQQKKEKAKEKRDREEGTSVQQKGEHLHRSTNSTIDEEVIQFQPTSTDRSSAPRSSRQPGDTAIQGSRPRQPPSPGSSRIAMVSYDVDWLPRSSRSDRFFEWN